MVIQEPEQFILKLVTSGDHRPFITSILKIDDKLGFLNHNVYGLTLSYLNSFIMVELVGNDPTSQALQASANPSQLQLHYFAAIINKNKAVSEIGHTTVKIPDAT